MTSVSKTCFCGENNHITDSCCFCSDKRKIKHVYVDGYGLVSDDVVPACTSYCPTCNNGLCLTVFVSTILSQDDGIDILKEGAKRYNTLVKEEEERIKEEARRNYRLSVEFAELKRQKRIDGKIKQSKEKKEYIQLINRLYKRSEKVEKVEKIKNQKWKK